MRLRDDWRIGVGVLLLMAVWDWRIALVVVAAGLGVTFISDAVQDWAKAREAEHERNQAIIAAMKENLAKRNDST